MASKKSNSWFAVDRDGLAKLLEARGKAFAIFELVQNAWDTDTGSVEISLTKLPGRPLASLTVMDEDPEGFKDLTHAFTLFAPSEKVANPEKRGRFNLGEKLVLALCKEAMVQSTKGTVRFTEDGKRQQTKEKRKAGTEFSATIRMTNEEYDEVCEAVHSLIPPMMVPTYFNGETIEQRIAPVGFETTLPTLVADDEGILKRTKRKTSVEIFEPLPGEEPYIYEMGIPVVPTDGKWHVNVHQKVPLNMDRDNVPPSYLRLLRAEVLNHAHELLDKEDATEAWVSDALESDALDDEALETVVTQRYGDKRAVYDPSDPEANNRLVSQGYTLIHGGAFSKGTWGRIKGSGVARPSGQLAPTPQPYSTDPNADPVKTVPEEKWTQGMREVVQLSKRLATKLMGVHLNVSIVRAPNFSACFGSGVVSGSHLDFSLQRLGHRWFNNWRQNRAAVFDLLIHEFAHHYEENHLSEHYHEAVSKLGGKLAELALTEPDVFDVAKKGK